MARKPAYNEKMVMIGIRVPQSLKEFLTATGMNVSQQVRHALEKKRMDSFFCERCKVWTVDSINCKWCEAKEINIKKTEIIKEFQNYLIEQGDSEGTHKLAKLLKIYESEYVEEGE